MQETQIPSLIQEEPTCHGAIKPCATTTEALVPRVNALQQEKTLCISLWVRYPLPPSECHR